MKVSDLRSAIEDCDPDGEVRLAIQISYPFEYSVDRVEEVAGTEGNVVYLSQGCREASLSGEARDALGW